ncbi:MAG: hypothetical protein GX455_10330 [Phycisphaerae bacterium]|nr:hypothetical protein [Phycisphaerae bacterium]
MFLPYSYDIEYDRRPWMAYVLVPLIVGLTVYHLRAFNSAYLTNDVVVMYREGVRVITPGVKWIYLAVSAVYLWVFATAACSKIGNWIFLFLMILLLLPLELTWYFSGRLTFQPTSCLIQVMLGICLFFWPTISVDCFVTLPAKILFSLSMGWLVTFWFIVDVALAFLYRWSAAYLLLPLCLLGGVLAAGLLNGIGAAIMDTEDRTLWQVFRGEEEPDHSWEDSWSARKHKQEEKKAEQNRTQPADESPDESENHPHAKMVSIKGK